MDKFVEKGLLCVSAPLRLSFFWGSLANLLRSQPAAPEEFAHFGRSPGAAMIHWKP